MLALDLFRNFVFCLIAALRFVTRDVHVSGPSGDATHRLKCLSCHFVFGAHVPARTPRASACNAPCSQNKILCFERGLINEDKKK